MTDQPSVAIRPFEFQSDLAAVKRIWREVGWVDAQTEAALDDFFAVGDALLAIIDGSAECSVHVTPGHIRLQSTDLPLCAVTAVTTSRVARGYGFAKRLTALQLRKGFESGAAMAALGMFDQGFYDQLGFGNGAYDHEFSFDPAELSVSHRVPAPRRLSIDDFAQIHQCMCRRARVNGSVWLDDPRLMRAELGLRSDGFGLGYFDQDELTHFVWLTGTDEHGPYQVKWIGYRSAEQLVQLLGLLKSLADQIYSVRMVEPPHIQLQSLLQRPFRNRVISRGSTHGAGHRAFCWWQLRMLDVARCVSAVTLNLGECQFQLDLHDPLASVLSEDSGWQGVAGSYLVTLGAKSSAVPGESAELPRIECSVNAFTRLLFAAAPASSLAITDGLQAPAALLAILDDLVHWQAPKPGWEF